LYDSSSYTGIWTNNSLSSQNATIQYEDLNSKNKNLKSGVIYKGDVVNSIPNGNGTFYVKAFNILNSYFIEGFWKNGTLNKVSKVVFNNEEFLKLLSIDDQSSNSIHTSCKFQGETKNKEPFNFDENTLTSNSIQVSSSLFSLISSLWKPKDEKVSESLLQTFNLLDSLCQFETITLNNQKYIENYQFVSSESVYVRSEKPIRYWI